VAVEVAVLRGVVETELVTVVVALEVSVVVGVVRQLSNPSVAFFICRRIPFNCLADLPQSSECTWSVDDASISLPA
jgi:hypothetical protein